MNQILNTFRNLSNEMVPSWYVLNANLEYADLEDAHFDADQEDADLDKDSENPDPEDVQLFLAESLWLTDCSDRQSLPVLAFPYHDSWCSLPAGIVSVQGWFRILSGVRHFSFLPIHPPPPFKITALPFFCSTSLGLSSNVEVSFDNFLWFFSSTWSPGVTSSCCARTLQSWYSFDCALCKAPFTCAIAPTGADTSTSSCIGTSLTDGNLECS